MRILITGFDPFGKDLINPSFQAVSGLSSTINNTHIDKLELPTEYMRAAQVLLNTLKTHDYSHVILVGQAAGRSDITLERYALNVMNSTNGDNVHYKPNNETILKDTPHAYETSLNVEQLVQTLQKADIPASISYHAGTFVCNSTYYHLLDHIKASSTQGLFVHIPIVESQRAQHKDDTPFLQLEVITKALELMITTLTTK